MLTFDGKQRAVTDLARIDPAAAMSHLALGQSVADEDGIDGLQIILAVRSMTARFVVELAVLAPNRHRP